MAKHGLGGGARHLTRWTLLGSGKEEVMATDDERRHHCYRGQRWVGSSPAAGSMVPSDGVTCNDEGGGPRDLKADGPPPPPSWLDYGLYLRERMNRKDK